MLIGKYFHFLKQTKLTKYFSTAGHKVGCFDLTLGVK